MSKPVYHIVFHDGHWRIRFENLHIGEFRSADMAVGAALQVVNSSLDPSPRAVVMTGSDGEITIGHPEESRRKA
jgi:hypothetical protein